MNRIKHVAFALALFFATFLWCMNAQAKLIGATEDGYADLLAENRDLRKDIKDLSKMLIESHTHVRNLYNNYVKAMGTN